MIGHKKIHSFQDLIVWQKAHQLMLDIYALLEKLPKEEKYNRVSQLRRSTSSTPANIAEGFGRYHYQENIQFCRQARGSLEETKNHIFAIKDLCQVPADEYDKLIQQCDEVKKILNAYINSTKNRQIDKIAVVLLLFSLFSFLFSPHAHAASSRMYLQASNEEAGINSEFTVKVLVDSDIPLNAYAAEINYPPQLLEPVRFDNSFSLINFWHDEPLVFANGRIMFNGGSPAPFEGEGGELLTIYFKARQEGLAELSLINSAVYAADGKGTEISPEIRPLTVTIKSGAISAGESAHIDTAPPEIKFLSIVPDPFKPDQKLVGIVASDPGSGVKETLLRWRSLLLWDEWQLAKNPTAVPKNVWAVQIRVFDNQGNVTERTIYDWQAFRLRFTNLFVILLIIISIFIIIVAVINRRRKTKRATITSRV